METKTTVIDVEADGVYTVEGVVVQDALTSDEEAEEDTDSTRSAACGGYCSSTAQECSECGACLKLCCCTMRDGCVNKDWKGCMRDIFTLETLRRKLPVIRWLPKYRLHHFQGDLVGGLTIGITVLPQGLAYAKIAGLPPEYGLYAAFMCCYVYFFLGTSYEMNMGPAAIMSLLVGQYGKSPIPGDPTYAIVLSLVCGCIQFVIALLRIGVVVDYISLTVIHAYTQAAVVTIAFGQVPNWFGLNDIPQGFINQVYWVCKKLPETQLWDFLLGLGGIIALYLMQVMGTIQCGDKDNRPLGLRIFLSVVWFLSVSRNAIVVLACGGMAAIFLQYDMEPFSLTGNITEGLPPFKPPAFSVSDGNTTYTAIDIFKSIGGGLIIVPLFGLVELVAVGKALSAKNNYKIDPDQEFIAIGVSNILGSFVSAYPITASISRCAVALQSGVKTPVAGLYCGTLVVLTLAFLTPIFYFVPDATLAAVIIMAVASLADVKLLRDLWIINKSEYLAWAFTFIISLLFGIETGLLVGIAVSLFILLYPAARPRITMEQLDTIAVLTPDQGLVFPGSEYLKEMAIDASVTEDGSHRCVVIDFEHITTVDYTSIRGLRELISQLASNNKHAVFCNIKMYVLKIILEIKVVGFVYTSTLDEAVTLAKEYQKAIVRIDLVSVAASLSDKASTKANSVTRKRRSTSSSSLSSSSSSRLSSRSSSRSTGVQHLTAIDDIIPEQDENHSSWF